MAHLIAALPVIGQIISAATQNWENKAAQGNNDNQRTIARGMAGADWSQALKQYQALMAANPAPYANAQINRPPPGMPTQGPQLAQLPPQPVAGASQASQIPPGLAQLIGQSAKPPPPPGQVA